MAFTTTHVGIASPFALIGQVFAMLGNALVSIGENSTKMRQIQALSALSDEELAERGLRREDIVRSIMLDHGWA